MFYVVIRYYNISPNRDSKKSPTCLNKELPVFHHYVFSGQMILLCVCEVFLYEFDLKKLRYLVAFLKVIFVYRFSVLKPCCQ